MALSIWWSILQQRRHTLSCFYVVGRGSMMSSPQRWWGHVWASIFVVCEGPLLMGRTFDMLCKTTLRGGRLWWCRASSILGAWPLLRGLWDLCDNHRTLCALRVVCLQCCDTLEQGWLPLSMRTLWTSHPAILHLMTIASVCGALRSSMSRASKGRGMWDHFI